jgi:hypothetical protein
VDLLGSLIVGAIFVGLWLWTLNMCLHMGANEERRAIVHWLNEHGARTMASRFECREHHQGELREKVEAKE